MRQSPEPRLSRAIKAFSLVLLFVVSVFVPREAEAQQPGLSITPDLASPQPANQAITWTATVSGGISPFTFKWFVSSDNGANWTEMTGWSSSPTFQWTPSNPGSAYFVSAWVRNYGNTSENRDDGTSRPYTVTQGLTISLTSNLASPQVAGTSITWTATPSGGASPFTYKWWLSSDAGVNWTQLTGWLTSNTYVWTPTTAGTQYRVAVWVRNSGNTAENCNACVLQPYTVSAAPPPTISSLTPTSGSAGTSVAIAGTNFLSVQGSSTVTFNGTPATTITGWTNTGITATVPTGAATGNVIVTVGGVASNASPFTVTTAPTISSLSSSSGPVGGTVTITGANFGASRGTSIVRFGGTDATSYPAWSATSITVMVPTGATTGNAVVTVNGQASNGVTFAVTPPPSISSLSPTSGYPGQSITIAGSNFGTPQGTNTVSFNGVTANATSWNATSITATVPASAATGPVAVTVAGVASSGVTFTVIPLPAISSLTPNAGTPGQSVTIAGSNFGTMQGSTVTFNGTPATTIGSWSPTSIVATVPVGATTGPVVVTTGGASNGVTFTVAPAPVISSLSSTSGTAGSAITITGSNFGATQNGSTVRFNGTLATTISIWSATSITAIVPSSATPGPVVVTVLSQASNGVLFATPPAAVNLSANRTAPQPAGTPITWTAAGIHGLGPYQYKFFTTSDYGATWTMVRDWNELPTYVWTPSQANSQYGVSVWVRSSNNTTDDREDGTWRPFAITAPPPPSPYASVSLSVDKTSPQPGGSVIRFTATGSGGTPPYQYRYGLSSDGGGTWQIVREWHDNGVLDWLPTQQTSGYVMSVVIRSANNSTDNYEDGTSRPYTITGPPAHIASLTSSLPSPQPTGTTVTWAATAIGGNTPYSYKFFLSSDAGVTWTMERDWSPTNTYAWTPALKNWGYRIKVRVRSALNPTEMPEGEADAPFEISTGSAPTSAVIWDTFTSSGAMDGRIPDNAPPGRSWSRIQGGLSPVLNGLAVGAPAGAASGFTTEVIDSGISNGQVAVDFRSTSTMPAAALVLRSVDANNLLLLRYIGGPATGRVELVKRVAGQLTVVQWVPVGPVQVGSPHRLEAHLSGTSITARFDGLSVFEVSLLDHQGATRHGVSWEIPAAWSTTYDEFEVSNAAHVSTLPAGTRCIGNVTKQIIRVFPGSDEMAGRTEVLNMPHECQYRIRLFAGGRATLNGPTLRNGNGAVGFFFNYDYNSPFISFAVVAGHFVTLSQTSTTGIECSFALSTTVLEYPETGGTDSFTVTPSHPGVCPWAAVFGEPWVTIYNAGIHTGPATVIATVDPNPLQITRDARGYVGIVGDVKLQQIADPCVFSVNQTSFSNLSRFGGPMEVTVTIPNGCGWETWSLTEGIVRVDSPLPEDNPAGTGQIHMYLLENTAAGPRIGRVHVGKPYSVYESLEIELIQCGTSSPVCPMGPEEDPDDDLPPPNGNDPGGDSSFFHLDALGSVRMVTDVNQQILGRYDYQPFGQDWETTGSSPATNTLRFTAKERDLETAVGQWQALDYSGARYYQSQTGRFTSVDPVLRVDLALSNPQRWNRFANAGNNPVRFVDPDGRDWVDFVNGVANAIRSNLLFGLGRSDGNADFRTGQAVGDVISVVQGALEVLGGVGTTGAGVVACGTGAACLVGAPAAVAGDLVTAHGVGVVAAAGASLMKSSSDGSGSSGGGRRTTNEDEVFGRLEENHGIKRADASQRLHRIKKDAGRRGADNVEFDLTGNVYDPVTGEWLGSLTEGGGSHP